MPTSRELAAAGATIGLSILGYILYKKLYSGACSVSIAALNPTEFRSFTVLKNAEVSHNTRRLTFALPKGTTTLGLPVASCLVARTLDANNLPVIRPYTPVTTEGESKKNGSFDLIVKKYLNGPMSTFLCGLKPGETVEFKGPIPKIDLVKTPKNKLGMIAGGTGITPMLQIIHFLLSKKTDKTEMSLIFANVQEEDILVREELQYLVKTYPDRFKVYYTLDRPIEGWNQGKGYVSQEMIKKNLFPPGPDTLIMVCGPDAMLGHVSGKKNPDRTQGELGGLLKEAGYSLEHVFKF